MPFQKSIIWVVFAVCQSAVIFGLDFLVATIDVITEDGKVNGYGHTMMNIAHMMVWPVPVNVLLARSGSTSS